MHCTNQQRIDFSSHCLYQWKETPNDSTPHAAWNDSCELYRWYVWIFWRIVWDYWISFKTTRSRTHPPACCTVGNNWPALSQSAFSMFCMYIIKGLNRLVIDIFWRLVHRKVLWNTKTLLEKFSLNCRKVVGFALRTLHIVLKNSRQSVFHPIRSKTKTNRVSLSRVFPRFASATCNYIEFWLVPCIVCALCDWLVWLL